jgi:hypothetical protein
MKPRVTFGDPETLLANYLRTELAARPESYKPASVGMSYPSAKLVNATHVQVDLEVGNADDYPVTERAQVRVTCHAPFDDRTDVKALASLAQSIVYSHPGDANVAGCTILVGRSNVITDPDTKNRMVWFLARVNLKATLRGLNCAPIQPALIRRHTWPAHRPTPPSGAGQMSSLPPSAPQSP